jgi:ABC-type spermidine/putrescine transport system permease subunit I
MKGRKMLEKLISVMFIYVVLTLIILIVLSFMFYRSNKRDEKYYPATNSTWKRSLNEAIFVAIFIGVIIIAAVVVIIAVGNFFEFVFNAIVKYIDTFI